MRLFPLVVVIAATAVLGGCDRLSEDGPGPGWEYIETKDELRGTSTRLAIAHPVDPSPFGPLPLFRVADYGDKVRISVSLQGGAFTCEDGDQFLVSFDRGPIHSYPCLDMGNNNLAFGNSGDLFQRLRSAKRFVVEMPIMNAPPQFVFEAGNLELGR